MGLDIGTMFLVKAEEDELVGGTGFTVERNVFLQAATTDDTEETLKENHWAYAKHGDEYYILGEDALKLKNLLTVGSKKGADDIVMTKVGDLRRPMQRGILNTSEEKLSVAIIQKIISNLVGKPSEKDEVLCYCAPGDPVDSNLSVMFHKGILTKFLSGLGYHVECIPEALAIIFSECPSVEDDSVEGGKADFSGISFSFGAGMCNICFAYKKLPLIAFSVARCIPAGNKVITTNGFTNIEDILVGDSILTKKGTWSKVINTSKKHCGHPINNFGTIYKFTALGQCKFSTTDDHLIFVQRDSEWGWRRADSIQIGDKVQQPWPQTNNIDHVIGWTDERTGEYHKKQLFSDDFYVLGRYLGDGSIFQNSHIDRGIRICCNISDQTVEELSRLMQKSFYREPEVVLREDDNVIELKLHDSGLAKWFRTNSYNSLGEKILPWDVTTLKENYLRFLIAGIIDSDGYVDPSKNRISIEITSPYVAQASYLILLKLGLKPSITWRDRSAESHLYKDKEIRSTKESYVIQCSGFRCMSFIKWLGDRKIFFDKTDNEGMTVATITEIEKITGTQEFVYDLGVEDDSHSFCLAGCVVHNCGDWIDQEAAKVAGVDQAAITRYKETNFDLDNVDYSNMKDAALDIFYASMIEHALDNFSRKFNQLDRESQTMAPLEIVVAGGTASVPGFLSKFKAVLDEKELPFNIKSVRMAEEPLYTVASGCLAKAISVENKRSKETPEKPKKDK